MRRETPIPKLALAACGGLLALAAAWAAVPPQPVEAAKDEVMLVFYVAKGTQITNAEGKTLKAGEGDRLPDVLSGDMNRIYENIPGVTGTLQWHVTVPASSEFTLTNPQKQSYFEVVAGDEAGASALVESGCSSIAIRCSGRDWSVTVAGAKGKVAQDVWRQGGPYLSVTGKARGTASLSSTAEGAVVRGVSGAATVESDTFDSDDSGRSARYYLPDAGRGYAVSAPGKKPPRVSGAYRIRDGLKGRVTMLGARPAAGGRAAFVTWNKVRGARSYRLYRWDAAAGRWRAAALRKGRSANWCLVKGTAPGSVERFRVRAFARRGGRGPVCKASYRVSVLCADPARARANASSVAVPRGPLALKTGRSRRLAAEVAAPGGARPLASSVRWYSSNAKVASVGRKTGRVTARSKGTCTVWAKAHNGVNSRHVKVTVR